MNVEKKILIQRQHEIRSRQDCSFDRTCQNPRENFITDFITDRGIARAVKEIFSSSRSRQFCMHSRELKRQLRVRARNKSDITYVAVDTGRTGDGSQIKYNKRLGDGYSPGLQCQSRDRATREYLIAVPKFRSNSPISIVIIPGYFSSR